MKNFLKRFKTAGEGGLSVLSSMVAVLIGLLVGLIILLITDASKAGPAFVSILTFGFQSSRNFGEVLYYATPVILTGLSVGFAYKTGLFNIGASGQFTFGAYVAILIAHTAEFLPPVPRILASLICAILAGALWAAIPGFLKAYRNVHEVISCIMCNWIGIFLVNYFILNTIYDADRNSSSRVPSEFNIPSLGLGTLFQGDAIRPSSVNAGIIIAIFVAIVIYIVLEKTKFGYELKACGFNKDAAKYAGISEKRNIILSMMIAGGLSGLGGALYFLSGAGVTMNVKDVLAYEGFTGISVALLGLSSPIGIIFAGILIGYLHLGGFQMQLFGFVPEIIEIVTAVIIYLCAFVLLIKVFFAKTFLKKTESGDKPGDLDEPPGDLDEPPEKPLEIVAAEASEDLSGKGAE